MCRNHSHAVVDSTEAAILPDGTVVHIAQLKSGVFLLENPSTGTKLMQQRCATLLLLAPGQDTACYSPSALMAALAALCCVLAESENEPGTVTPMSSQMPWWDLPPDLQLDQTH